MEGTSIETIESQPQQDQPCSGHSGRNRREAFVVFDVMGCLALVPVGTPSLLDADEDDDMSNVRHVAKAQKREGHDVEWVKNPLTS